MVLGDEHDVLRAGIANGLHPLVGIEAGGVESGGAGGAVAPFAIEEGVGGEVNDDAELEVLPGGLIGGRADVAGCILGVGGRDAEGGEEECEESRTQPARGHLLIVHWRGWRRAG